MPITIGRPDIAERLLDNRANMEARDSDGRTPLLQAAEANSLECLRMLHHRGASVRVRDAVGRGVVIYCAMMGVGQSVAASEHIINYALKSGLDVNEVDRYGRTALDYARMRGEEEITAFLIARGAKSGQRGGKGTSRQ